MLNMSRASLGMNDMCLTYGGRSIRQVRCMILRFLKLITLETDMTRMGAVDETHPRHSIPGFSESALIYVEFGI
jgi:hypothetical protein